MSLTSAFKRLSPAGGLGNKFPLPSTGLELETPRLILRLGQPRDWQAWKALRSESETFLKPWEPTWPPEALTFEYFTNMLRRQWREWKEGTSYGFLIFLKDEHEKNEDGSPLLRIIGGITLSNIERGAAQRGRLGYWVGLTFARQGFMTEALTKIDHFAFELLRLHRLEASCMPHNEASKALLTKMHFDQEGLAKSFLKINGQWCDQVLWGKTNH